jgi:hypothetical protein
MVTMTLWDAFEVIVLPRRVTRRFRFARFFYRFTWRWRRMFEPNVQALSNYLLISLPPWFRISETPDSWQISSWQTPILSIATENSAIQETNGKRFAEG